MAASSPSVNAWVCGGPGGFYGLAGPYSVVTPEQVMRQKEMIRRRQREILSNSNNAWKGFKDSMIYPRYEITDNENKFQVALDVPGVLMEDIEITVQDEGTILSITGMRKALDDASTFVSKFSRQFSLDDTVDVDKFSASLQNGVLIVTAPKQMERIQETIRKIPIMELNDGDDDANVSTEPSMAKDLDTTATSSEAKVDDDDDEEEDTPDVPIETSKDDKEEPNSSSNGGEEPKAWSTSRTQFDSLV